jgi:hypothetical protein
MTLNRCLALALALLLLLVATSVQAQTYLPLVLGSDTAQSAEISYGFNQTLEPNQWIDIECVTGDPVATFDNGHLHVVCER